MQNPVFHIHQGADQVVFRHVAVADKYVIMHTVQNDRLRMVRSDVLLGFQLGHSDGSAAFHGNIHRGPRQVKMALGREAAFRTVDGVV